MRAGARRHHRRHAQLVKSSGMQGLGRCRAARPSTRPRRCRATSTAACPPVVDRSSFRPKRLSAGSARLAAATRLGRTVGLPIRRRSAPAPGRPAPSSWPAPHRSGRTAPLRPAAVPPARRPRASASRTGPSPRTSSPCSDCSARGGKSRTSRAMSGALPLTATRRNLPKRQRAVARSHTWLHVEAAAAGEAGPAAACPCTITSSSSLSRLRLALISALVGRAPRCVPDLSSSLNSASLPRWPLMTRKSLTMPASSCGSRCRSGRRSGAWRSAAPRCATSSNRWPDR